MVRYTLKRLCWMVPTLCGITLLTFLMLDLVPLDRAAAEVAGGPGFESRIEREAAVQQLRVRYGLVDPETGERLSVWRRYGNWLGHVASLDFAGEGEDPGAFRARLARALAVSLLLGGCALLVAFGVGIPLGAWLGMRARARADRMISTALLSSYALPQFLLATLLLLFLGGGIGAALLPSSGLRSAEAGDWGWPRQVLDLLLHLVLPVTAIALGPLVAVVRYVRESVARVAHRDFVLQLRGWGMTERAIRQRVLRNGLAPLITLTGTLVPALLTGSVIVESVFAVPGLGRLAFTAVMERNVSTVMAFTLLAAVITMLGLLSSDLLHRRFDPRVELR